MAATHTIRTTMRPGDEIVVGHAEYEDLLERGLIYDGTPPDPVADPLDARLAERLLNDASSAREVIDELVGESIAALSASIFYGSDPNVARPAGPGPMVWVGYSGVVPINALAAYDIIYTFPAAAVAPPNLAWLASFWAGDIAATDGAKVAQWNDRTVNARHAVQATDANRPTYRAADGLFGGQAVLDFTTTTTRLVTPTWTSTQTQPTTIAVVASVPDLAGATQRIVVDGVDPAARNTVIRTGDGKIGQFAGTAVGSATMSSAPHLIVAVFNGASSRVIVDGVETVAPINPGAQGMSGLTIGARVSTFVDGFAGKLAFVGTVAGSISSGAAADLRTWAQTNYGTP